MDFDLTPNSQNSTVNKEDHFWDISNERGLGMHRDKKFMNNSQNNIFTGFLFHFITSRDQKHWTQRRHQLLFD